VTARQVPGVLIAQGEESEKVAKGLIHGGVVSVDVFSGKLKFVVWERLMDRGWSSCYSEVRTSLRLEQTSGMKLI
jgi:hypothetical protein